MSGDFAESGPAGCQFGLRIMYGAPRPGRGVLGHEHYEVFRIVFPLTADGNPKLVANLGYTLEAEMAFSCLQF